MFESKRMLATTQWLEVINRNQELDDDRVFV